MNKKYILVGGLPRTGGSLIPFFLDGQLNLKTIPFEQHVSSIIGNIPRNKLFSRKVNVVLKNILRSSLLNKNSNISRIDKSKQIYDFNKDLYINEIKEFVKKEGSTKNYLYKTSQIWLKNRGVDVKDDLILNHSGRGFFYETEKLFNDLDIGYYLYTKRNFLDWYSSITKSTNLLALFNDKDFLSYSFDIWNISNELAIYYAKKYQDKFLIIDYDDLISQPLEKYEVICNFLNLDYDKNFNLAPTYLGKNTSANSSFKEKKETSGKLIVTKNNEKLYDEATLEFIEDLKNNYIKIDFNNLSESKKLYHKMFGAYFQYWGLLRNNDIKKISNKNLFLELKNRFFTKFLK